MHSGAQNQLLHYSILRLECQKTKWNTVHTCAWHYLVVKSALSQDLQYPYIAINLKQYMYQRTVFI